MYGSVNDTFSDGYPYFQTVSKKQRTGTVNSYDFKLYYFPYSVNRKSAFTMGLDLVSIFYNVHNI